MIDRSVSFCRALDALHSNGIAPSRQVETCSANTIRTSDRDHQAGGTWQLGVIIPAPFHPRFLE